MRFLGICAKSTGAGKGEEVGWGCWHGWGGGELTEKTAEKRATVRSGQSWLCKCLEEEQSRRRNSMGKGPGAGVGEKTGRPAWLKQREGGGSLRGPGNLRRAGRKVGSTHTSTSPLMEAGWLSRTFASPER